MEENRNTITYDDNWQNVTEPEIPVFHTPNENNSNLEYETTFDTFIKDDMNYQYNLTCHLWRPYDNRIRIICKLNKELNLEKSHITFHSTYFDYYNYSNDSYFKYQKRNDSEIRKIILILSN